MKKNNTRSEKRIKRNEKNLFIKKLKALGLMMISFFIILTSIMRANLEVNKELMVNTAILYLYNILEHIFGNMIYVFAFGLAVYAKRMFFDERIKIRRVIFFIFSFLVISSYMTIRILPDMEYSTTIDAGQKILEFGFEKKGAGLIGAITSIPFYSLIKNEIFNYSHLALVFLLVALYFKNIITKFYITVKSAVDYYNSDEYKDRVRILNAKKEFELREEKRLEKIKEEQAQNVFITLSKEKLDKEIAKKPKASIFSKTEYYDEDELEQKQKQWIEYVNQRKTFFKEQENVKEDVEKSTLEDNNISNTYEEKNELIKNTKVEEAVENTNINENVTVNNIENIDNNQNIMSAEDRKALQKSIDEVFIYKKMDETKKSAMLKQIKENIAKLERVLKEYGVEAKVVDYVTGPTITRYEIKIPTGVRVNKVTQLSDEISMYLSAESIRFEAPIPGKDTIGIETPNKIKEPVYFSNLLHSKELEKGELSVILGKDIIGKDRIIDIAKMPHLLIAGQTGSGKSVAINTILSTLISKKTEQEVKFILVDPKMVELMPYNGIPHLLVPVIIDPTQAAIALKWTVNEMEERYKKLASLGVRNIKTYNEFMRSDKMPYIVVIIDELADLMMVSANSVEISIARIAQKARAVGIHLIVATQRPSTDVITGMIKANLPSRISFALRSQIDSRTILDQIGAEKLLGMGDMLLLESGKSKLDRIQGAYISDDEVINLTTVLKKNRPANYNMQILEPPLEDNNNIDPYYERAVNLVKQYDDRISISMLQRELQIGFNRASRICKDLKDNGIIDDNNQLIIND